MKDLLVIGGGVGGYSAAMYAKRFEMDVVVVSDLDGGTITKTHLVENYPGFPSITGFELGMNVVNHAKSIGVETKMTSVTSLKKENNIFTATLANGEIIESKTVLLATGTKHRELGLESEQRLKNKGVSYCATCDAAFFREKVVAVVGGSDSAVKESLLLSKFASKVYVIYRGAEVRPEPVNKKRMDAEPKIEVVNNANVIEVLGENKVSGVKLDTGVTLDLEGLFIEIGGTPQTELAKELGVELNAKGEVVTNKFAETSLLGFYAAGDVCDSPFKQAIVAASDGAYAANSAFNYVNSN